jgi:hypothetical protein
MDTTLEKPVTITEAAPLTVSEQSSLISMAARNERTARVQGSAGTSRGWQMGGNVD